MTMFFPLSTDDLSLLRSRGQRTELYMSALIPPTLWEARINEPGIVLGQTTFDFNNGTGSFFSMVEALQEVWVGTEVGAYDIARLRIKSISSGDGGVTGTLTVSGHSATLTDTDYLTFVHNYPIKPKYSFIDTNGTFYMDDNVSYSGQNTDITPVAIAGPHQAGRLVGGTKRFYVDCSPSYAVKPGESIASYSMSVASTADTATVSFDTTIGVGYFDVDTAGVYWAKFTVTDTNAQSQATYRCFIVHDYETFDYPLVDFDAATISGAYDQGGWNLDVGLKDNAQLTDIPDLTLVVLWYEPTYDDTTPSDTQKIMGVVGPTSDPVVFHHPRISYTVSGSDITVRFRTRVTINGEAPTAGYAVGLNFYGGSCGPFAEAATTDDSYGNMDVSKVITGCDPSGTLEVRFFGTVLATYSYNTTQDGPELTQETPSLSAVAHQTVFVGYNIEDSGMRESLSGTSDVNFSIQTAQNILSRIFMFSASILAVEGTPGDWYEAPLTQTIGSLSHNILKWRSTALETTDVYGLNKYPMTSSRVMGEFPASDVYTSVNSFTYDQGVRTRMVSDRLGRLFFTPENQLLTDSQRTSIVKAFDLEARDWGGTFSITRKPTKTAPFVTVSGFSWDGTYSGGIPNALPHCAIAPGGKPEYIGSQTSDFPRQTFDDQQHANDIAGRYLAKINNQNPDLTFSMTGLFATVLEPAYAMKWRISLPAGVLPRGVALTNIFLYCKSVTINYSSLEGTLSTDVTFEMEAKGESGVTTECPSFPDTGGEDPPQNDLTIGAVFTAASVHYKPLVSTVWTKRVSEAVLDMTLDPYWYINNPELYANTADMVRVGSGYIKTTTDGFNLVNTTVTPGTNPPNAAGDSPAPTAGDLDYVFVDASFGNEGHYIVLANWQNSGGTWRSWLYQTEDNFATGTWYPLVGGIVTNEVDSYGTTTLFESTSNTIDFNPSGATTASSKNIAVLDSTRFVVLYQEYIPAAPDDLKVVLGTISGGTISYGTPVTINTGYFQQERIVALDNDQLIVAYVENTTGTYIEAIAVQLVGSTLSGGTPGVISTTAEVSVNVCKLTNTTAIVAWTEAGTPQVGKVRTVPVSGTTVGTLGTPANFSSDNPFGVDLVALSQSHIVVAYINTNDSDYVYLRAATISSGTAVFGGSETKLSTQTLCYYINLAALSSSKMLVTYESSSGGGVYVTAADVVTYSITPGTEYTMSSDCFSNGSVSKVSSSVAIVSYTAYSGGKYGSYTRTLTLNGLGITLGTESLDVDSATYEPIDISTEFIFGTMFVSAYEDNLSDGRSFLGYLGGGSPAFMGLGVSLSKNAGLDTLWVTGWNSTGLELQEWTWGELAMDAAYDLGNALEAQVTNRTLCAWPETLFFAGDVVIVYGRMDSPIGLPSIAHIIKLDEYRDVSAMEDTWSTDYCGAVKQVSTSATQIYAIKNSTSSCSLYRGSILLADFTYRGVISGIDGVNPHGIWIDKLRGNVMYVANKEASNSLIKSAKSPYLIWKDITYDHEVTNGINSIVVV